MLKIKTEFWDKLTRYQQDNLKVLFSVIVLSLFILASLLIFSI